MFDVYLSRKASKTLKRFDKKTADKIKRILTSLKTSPIPIRKHDIRKVSGARDFYRIRVSDFRIVYRILWGIKEINVIKISRKDDETYKLKR